MESWAPFSAAKIIKIWIEEQKPWKIIIFLNTNRRFSERNWQTHPASISRKGP
jgi:hypothetical protein